MILPSHLLKHAPAGRTRTFLIIGFGAIVLVCLLLAAVGLTYIYNSQSRISAIVENHNVKVALLNEMYTSARERSLLLHAMLDLDDPFDRDELYLEFNRHGGRFAQARIKLKSMQLTPDEIRMLNEQGELSGIAIPTQTEVIDLIQAGRIKEAKYKLLQESLPAQNRVLKKLLELQEFQKIAADQIARQSQRTIRSAMLETLTLGSIAIILSCVIAFLIIRRVTRTEIELQIEKRLAETTLHSIAEAVITTDQHGNIAYINPMAEALTGWKSQEITGRPFAQVINIYKEDNPQEKINPVLEAITEKEIHCSTHDMTLISRNKTCYAIDYTVAPIRDENESLFGGILIFRDVTELRSLSTQLSYQASHDSLTGLINRNEFEQRLKHAIDTAQNEKMQHVLCYVDLDQFKIINDTCGHAAGDELLKQLAPRLKNLLRESDTLARLGGDEFGILLTGCTLKQASLINQKILKAAKELRFCWDNKVFEIGASIGVVSINEQSGTFADILSAADTACYEAKDQGRNRAHIYDPNDVRLNQRRGEMNWVHRIKQAIDNEHILLYCQQVIPLDLEQNPDVHRYEILVRMQNTNGELISPNAFIPAAERFGLMPDVDRFIIKRALKYICCLDLSDKSVNFSLNISGQSVSDDRFLNFIVDEIDRADIDPFMLTFEITETAAITNLTRITRFISTLKGMGCSFALDDFGSGLSSFTYLKNIAVDFIKIDGSFIRDILIDETDHAFVTAITQIARIMKLKTIAEFVESEEILQELRHIGIDYAQGFYTGEPVPLTTAFPEQHNNRN